MILKCKLYRGVDLGVGHTFVCGKVAFLLKNMSFFYQFPLEIAYILHEIQEHPKEVFFSTKFPFS